MQYKMFVQVLRKKNNKTIDNTEIKEDAELNLYVTTRTTYRTIYPCRFGIFKKLRRVKATPLPRKDTAIVRAKTISLQTTLKSHRELIEKRLSNLKAAVIASMHRIVVVSIQSISPRDYGLQQIYK